MQAQGFDVRLFWWAYWFYLGAFLLFTVFGATRGRRVGRAANVAMITGFVLHSLGIVGRWKLSGHAPMANMFEYASLLAWMAVLSYLLLEFRYRRTIVGTFVAPVIVAVMTCASMLPKEMTQQLMPALQSYWLPVHVILAFLGNAVLAVAFAVSAIYLLQERHLKHKKMTALMKRFPPLESLDRLNYVLLVWGFPLMTLGILTGSLWAGMHWGNYWSWDPRQISSAIAWLLYAALLHARVTAGLRGKKAAILTMFGFCVVLGYFLWGDTLFPSRHGGRFE